MSAGFFGLGLVVLVMLGLCAHSWAWERRCQREAKLRAGLRRFFSALK